MDHLPRHDDMPPHHAPAGPVGVDGAVAYWHRLRRGRTIPARADLDPMALRPWLPLSGIVEQAPSGKIRFRLGGSGRASLMGVEVRGMPLRSLFAVGARPWLGDLAEAFLERVVVRQPTRRGRGRVLGERQDLVTPDVPCGLAGRSPCRTLYAQLMQVINKP